MSYKHKANRTLCQILLHNLDPIFNVCQIKNSTLPIREFSKCKENSTYYDLNTKNVI